MTEAGMRREEIMAAPIESAAQLAGVTVRQLRYWDEIGLVVPEMKWTVSPRRTIRLYRFTDLVELVAAARLRREQRMSLRQVRRVLAHVRELGRDAPPREVRFAAHAGEVVFELPDGTWSGGHDPGQVVDHRVLPLAEIRSYVLSEAGRRDPGDVGRIVRRRGVHGSKPVFAGTRVTVAAVHSHLVGGRTDEQILQAYPTLSPADIAAARAYDGAA
jgi:DNA-binding transcriptional MerR regulator/uncharacterized protein (DUF433 family)